MIDYEHCDRFVHITNEERFVIVRALGLLQLACDMTKDHDFVRRVSDLSNVFCEENWHCRFWPNTDKVRRYEK